MMRKVKTAGGLPYPTLNTLTQATKQMLVFVRIVEDHEGAFWLSGMPIRAIESTTGQDQPDGQPHNAA